jgi:hypothetical protein
MEMQEKKPKLYIYQEQKGENILSHLSPHPHSQELPASTLQLLHVTSHIHSASLPRSLSL